MKFTNVVTKIEFGKEDIRRALADYVDLEFHRPDLARSIRENKFKLTSSDTGDFSIKVSISK
tara:strand:- start:456 stop:641 length:186 start_codon:yes stop_codon:yes gene_type:complete